MHILPRRAAALALALLMPLTGCTGALAAVSPEQYESTYMQALSMAHAGNFAAAAETLGQIPLYQDAAMLAQYCLAADSAQQGEFSLAADAFVTLGGFKDSALQSAYCRARAAEAPLDDLTLSLDDQLAAATDAAQLYTQIPFVADSLARGERMQTAQAHLENKQALTRIYLTFEAENRLAVIVDDDEDGFIRLYDTHMNPVGDKTYTNLHMAFSEGLLAAKIGEKWGYVDVDGAVVIPPQWDSVNSFSNGFAAIGVGSSSSTRKYGFIDKMGNVVVEPQWTSVGSFDSNGFASITTGASGHRKYGYIDTTGTIIVQPQWDDMYGFYNGFARVKQGDKWGYIDTQGNVISQPQWDAANAFYGDYAEVKLNGKTGYIDKTGAVVIQPEWDSVFYYSYNNTFTCKRDGVSYILDATGTIIGTPAPRSTPAPREKKEPDGPFVFEEDGKFGLKAEDGSVLSAAQWDSVDLQIFSSWYAIGENNPLPIDHAVVELDGKFGMLAMDGSLLHAPQWDSVAFEAGYYYLFITELNGKFGFLAPDGSLIDEPIWTNQRELLIDFLSRKRYEENEAFLPLLENFKRQYPDPLILIIEGDKQYTLLNWDGEVLFDSCNLSTASFADGCTCVELGDEKGKRINWYLFDEQGNVIY